MQVIINTPRGQLKGTIVRTEKSRKYDVIYVVKTEKGIKYVTKREIKNEINM